MSTGEELPLMTNRGGMKEAVRSRTVETASRVTAVTSADVGAISFDDQLFGKLGPQNGSARVTSLDFENGIRTDQIIDVEANENENAMLWNAPDTSELELMDLRKCNQLRNPILAPRIHVRHL